jgi:hypothetical protein
LIFGYAPKRTAFVKLNILEHSSGKVFSHRLNLMGISTPRRNADRIESST